MAPLAITSDVLAGGWLLAVAPALRTVRNQPRVGLLCLALAGVHLLAGAWPALAPLVVLAWLGYALGLPHARLAVAWRRFVLALAAAGLCGWTVQLLATGSHPGMAVFTGVALGAIAVGAGAATSRLRKASVEDRRVLQWLAAASVLAAAAATVCLSLHAMTGSPRSLAVALSACLVVVPLGQAFASAFREPRIASVVVVESIAAAGVTALVAVVYLVVVVGINGAPHGHERTVLAGSLAAAVIVGLLAVPVRQRFRATASELVGGHEPSATEVVSTFGARMSRAVPMDELMLQLVESLRETLADAGAEIWTGADGLLVRTVSVPSLPPERIQLGEQERVVVGRARIGGPAWTSVWLPQLATPAAGDHRVAPIAHLGDLLGLLVVRRGAEAGPLTSDDEQSLVELARQLGLALHNVRLDSALQASLAELAQRNEELQASRLRIVNASDTARRTIERNLHDGAQQHLVALAVKLGLARQIAEEGDTDSVLELIEGLRADVQTTITELRELAHGIYPPLLRQQGLGEALRTAAKRSVLPCTVDVDLVERYPEPVETAAYFCCLEALQNAGKYAGADATVAIRVWAEESDLVVELTDDGAGFDASAAVHGAGFQNMQDRLGAIDGTLTVSSAIGSGTTVQARLPVCS